MRILWWLKQWVRAGRTEANWSMRLTWSSTRGNSWKHPDKRTVEDVGRYILDNEDELQRSGKCQTVEFMGGFKVIYNVRKKSLLNASLGVGSSLTIEIVLGVILSYIAVPGIQGCIHYTYVEKWHQSPDFNLWPASCRHLGINEQMGYFYSLTLISPCPSNKQTNMNIKIYKNLVRWRTGWSICQYLKF